MKTTKYFKLVIIALICIGVVFIWERYEQQEEFLHKLEEENQWNTHYQKEYEDYSNIRVLLTDSKDESYQHRSVKLQCKVPMQMSGLVNETIPANVIVDVGELLSEGETIFVSSTQSGVGVMVKTLEKGGKTPAYEGVLEISKEDGSYKIINELSLETYLKYVVPSEMPSSYPKEALKAQAVCARTYALRQIQEKRLEKYQADVDDTINFQVYAHISPQKTTTQAVKDTMGQIISYEGEPIEAYFFSTSCGFTSGMEVWNGKQTVPYLSPIAVTMNTAEDTEVFSVSKGILSEDAFVKHLKASDTNDLESDEKWYRWKVSFSWSELKKRASEQYPQIGKLENIKIKERSLGGAVISLELKGSKGSVCIETEYDVRLFFSPKDQTVVLQDGSKAPKQKLLPSAYFYIKKSYEGDSISQVQLVGGGYGHGVGLSQNGAKYMAKEGMSWRAIIKKFYKNITIIDIR